MKVSQAQNAKLRTSAAKAITLIEMIAVIVIVGLAIPSLALMWQNLAYQSGRSQTGSEAGFYAEELMEEIKAKKFQDPTQVPVFGPEPGENGRSDYDDVDDFNNYSDNPDLGYTRTVTVVYLDPNIANGGTWQVLVAGTSDFKRIRVEVSHQFGDAHLVTMVSAF